MLRSLEQYAKFLAREIAKPRMITPDVVRYIRRRYLVDVNKLDDFFINELPLFEGYEIDFILGPVFTPTIEEAAVYSALVEEYPLTPTEVGLLPDAVFELRPKASFQLPGDQGVVQIDMPHICLKRNISALRLDVHLHERVKHSIIQYAPSSDTDKVQALIRSCVPESPEHVELVSSFLHAVNDLGLYDFAFLEESISTLFSEQRIDFYSLEKSLQKILHACEKELSKRENKKLTASSGVSESDDSIEKRKTTLENILRTLSYISEYLTEEVPQLIRSSRRARDEHE